jgi:PilZ domain
MVEKRKEDRIVFFSMGVVRGTYGEVPCSVENISSYGASLCMSDTVEWMHQRGDIVHLKTTFLSPVELMCRVTRIDVDRIAVRFIT